MIRELVIGLAGAAIVVCGLQAQDTAQAATKGPDLPGITSKDMFPMGCVSCHAVLPDGKDVRLSAALKLVSGHPNVSGMVKTVPTDCKKCHANGTEKGLEKILHKMHYGKQEKSIYVQQFGGNCLNCHTLALKTGKMGIKSGPKNW